MTSLFVPGFMATITTSPWLAVKGVRLDSETTIVWLAVAGGLGAESLQAVETSPQRAAVRVRVAVLVLVTHLSSSFPSQTQAICVERRSENRASPSPLLGRS